MNSLCDVVPVRGGRSSPRIRGRSTACLAEVASGWGQGLDDSEPLEPSAPRECVDLAETVATLIALLRQGRLCWSESDLCEYVVIQLLALELKLQQWE